MEYVYGHCRTGAGALAAPRRARPGALGIAVLAALAGAGTAPAEAAAEPIALAEIIVTARKRDESMQDIPIAISVLPQAVVAEGNLDEIQEFLELVPNVKFKQDSFTGVDISIRGSSRSVNVEDPSVGLYRDGVYVGGLLSSFANFHDIERVEILRGPQAGLYGRNAVGGAVNIWSARPVLDQRSGNVELQYGSKSRSEVQGAVNLPLAAGRAALRLSGLLVDQQDGFQRFVNLDRYGDAHEYRSARARLLFAPAPALEFLTTVDYTEGDGFPSGVVVNAPNGAPLVVGPLTIPPTTPDDLDELQFDLAALRRVDQLQLIQEINWDIAPGRLTATFSYREADHASQYDTDRSIYDLEWIQYDASQDSFFAELRLASVDHGGFRYTVGATWLDERLQLDNQYQVGGEFRVDFASWFTTGLVGPNPWGIPAGIPIAALGLTPLGNSGGWGGTLGDAFPVSSINHQDLESLAAFLEASYQLNQRVELWGNLRYTRDRKNILFGQYFGNDSRACPVACPQVFALAFGGLDPVYGYPASRTFSQLSPGGGINFRLNDQVLLYAKVVTGFKAGGFNDLSASPELLPFEEETTISYEIGAKTSWWDQRLTLNAAAFYQERDDALVRITDPFMPIATLGINAGRITNQGFELDLRIAAAHGLEILLAGGYLDAELTDLSYPAQGIDYSGNTVPHTYKYTLSGVLRHSFALTESLEWSTYLSYSNGWGGYTNPNNLHRLDSPETVDLRFGVRNEHWSLAGYVDNLTDNQYAIWENYVGPTNHSGQFTPGRTYGVRAAYRY